MNSPDVMFRNGFPLAYQYTSAQPYHHGQTGTTGYYMWSGAAEPPATAQTLNDTGDSGNSSTMSSGSPPPQEALTAVEHHVTSLHPHNSHAHSHGHTPIKVEDAYGGSVPAYPAMQNHHFHYQQQIQVRSGFEDLIDKL